MPEKYLDIPNLMEFGKYIYSMPFFLRKLRKRTNFFTYNGKEYTYFEHPYNSTWMNERAVEISVMSEQLEYYDSQTILEIGNVFSHYFPVKHLVVDKYEKRKGMIAMDILDLDLKQKFDCIISISTLEHIGWDEIPRSIGKHRKAIEKILQLLSDKGTFFATIPLGYNPIIDKDIFNGDLNCNKVIYFKRLSREKWREANVDDVIGSQYGYNYRTTDGLALCIWKKQNNEGQLS